MKILVKYASSSISDQDQVIKESLLKECIFSEIDSAAKTISEHNPDVVINFAVKQTWHVNLKLPEKAI